MDPAQCDFDAFERSCLFLQLSYKKGNRNRESLIAKIEHLGEDGGEGAFLVLIDEFGNFASFSIFGSGRRRSRKVTRSFFPTPAEGEEKVAGMNLDKEVEFSLSCGSVDENGAGPPGRRAKTVKHTSAQKELAKKCALEGDLVTRQF